MAKQVQQDNGRSDYGFRRQVLSRRVLSDLKTRSTIGILFYLVALFVVIFSDGYYGRYPSFSKLFIIMMSGICIFRLIHMALDRYMPQTPFNTGVFITSVILTALFWGIGAGRFMGQPEALSTQILMVVCTIGLCSGGVVAFIPYIWLAIGFNASILTPPTVVMLTVTGHFSLGVLFLLFFTYMLFMTIRQNKEYWDALENEYLLKRLSNRDGLTGLFNRRYFDKTFYLEWKRAVRTRTRITILICDIDYFKGINDRYGHLAGDEYLKATARRLEKIFQRETDVVARYGGEEFVILMPGDSLENALSMAEKARQDALNTPLDFEETIIRATISFGVGSVMPKPDMEKETLLARADKALYAAKKNGRNRVWSDRG